MRWREKNSDQRKKLCNVVRIFGEITYRAKAGGTESRFHTVVDTVAVACRFGEGRRLCIVLVLDVAAVGHCLIDCGKRSVDRSPRASAR